MKIILFIAFGLFISECLAQGENPLEYYPHHVGDVWQYLEVPRNKIYTKEITRIDTSEDKNVHYIYYNNSIGWIEKVILDSALVYDRVFSSPWFKLNISLGEFWAREEGVEWLKYGMDDVERKWNQYFDTKVFYVYSHHSPDSSSGYSGDAEILAKNIGYFGREWEGGREELLGCIVDGKTYGTIVNVDEAENDNIVDSYHLSNFPNPFNPSTTITYSIPKETFLTISIYNSIGQKIETLFSGEKAEGDYAIKWLPSNLGSGTFFIVLETLEKTIVHKTLYLK